MGEGVEGLERVEQGSEGYRAQGSVRASTQLIRLVYVYRISSSNNIVFYIMNLHALRIS